MSRAERTRKLRLRFLETPKRFGVGELIDVDLNLRRLRPRLDHLGQHLPLLPGEAPHRLHQIWDQLGAALVLVLHLAPGGLGLLLERRNRLTPHPDSSIAAASTAMTRKPARCRAARRRDPIVTCDAWVELARSQGPVMKETPYRPSRLRAFPQPSTNVARRGAVPSVVAATFPMHLRWKRSRSRHRETCEKDPCRSACTAFTLPLVGRLAAKRRDGGSRRSNAAATHRPS